MVPIAHPCFPELSLERKTLAFGIWASTDTSSTGPIVRINPREIHISDPSFYNEIYAGNPKRVDGDYRHTRSTGVTKSMFSAVDHDLHQARRSSLTKFFSKRSINNIQPIIQDKVERVIATMQQACQLGSVVNLNVLAAAFAADTISHYSYGVSMGCLDGEGQNILTDATQAVLALSHWLRFLPIRFTNAKKLPPALVERALPKAAVVLRTHRTISALATEVLNAAEPKAPHENMFAALADPAQPAEERTLGRLEDEGFVVLAAGTETTAYSLSVTMFYLLDNPDIRTKLLDELRAVMPDPNQCPPLSVLENLPWLVSKTQDAKAPGGAASGANWTAIQRSVVNEGLRLSMGTLGRHPRVAPDRVLQYKDWAIPAGVSDDKRTGERGVTLLNHPFRRPHAVRQRISFTSTRKSFLILRISTQAAGFVLQSKASTWRATSPFF